MARNVPGGARMFHVAVRARKGTLLFRTWEEGLALWRAFTRAFPELVALCLMPDHVHLVLPHPDPGGRLYRAMSGYARWRNARRREEGPVWDPHAPPEALPDEDHARRTVRYVHLNPCRKGLVPDPLAWPLSTHRDAVGFALAPVVARDRDPARFHKYVSSDPSVSVAGTELPYVRFEDVRFEDVRDAVTSMGRVPAHAVRTRGPVRTLLLKAAWAHGLKDVHALAEAVGADTSTVWRTCARVRPRGANRDDPLLEACIRAVGDSRFVPLGGGDLRALPTWARYRRAR